MRPLQVTPAEHAPDTRTARTPPCTQLGNIKARFPGPQPEANFYLDSEGRLMMRPVVGGAGRSHLVAFRVLLRLAWGPPSDPRLEACHMACDCKACVNPAHGRWGTHQENIAEFYILKAFNEARRALPPGHAQRAFYDVHHPCRTLLSCQGFPRIR